MITTFKQLKISLFIASMGLWGFSCAPAHIHSGEKTNFSALIQQRHFTFNARKALAQNGFSRDLTSDYYLKVTSDSLIADLPYFGRAYRTPIDPTEGGISFISTHFSYQVTEPKKGGWSLEITPKEHHIQVDKMRLYISSDGFANLSVQSLHRQPISFYGKITSSNNENEIE